MSTQGMPILPIVFVNGAHWRVDFAERRRDRMVSCVAKWNWRKAARHEQRSQRLHGQFEGCSIYLSTGDLLTVLSMNGERAFVGRIDNPLILWLTHIRRLGVRGRFIWNMNEIWKFEGKK